MIMRKIGNMSLKEIIEETVASCIESSDVISSREVNDVFCADFASSIADNKELE
jgi:hypothetical protein